MSQVEKKFSKDQTRKPLLLVLCLRRDCGAAGSYLFTGGQQAAGRQLSLHSNLCAAERPQAEPVERS